MQKLSRVSLLSVHQSDMAIVEDKEYRRSLSSVAPLLTAVWWYKAGVILAPPFAASSRRRHRLIVRLWSPLVSVGLIMCFNPLAFLGLRLRWCCRRLATPILRQAGYEPAGSEHGTTASGNVTVRPNLKRRACLGEPLWCERRELELVAVEQVLW